MTPAKDMLEELFSEGEGENPRKIAEKQEKPDVEASEKPTRRRKNPKNYAHSQVSDIDANLLYVMIKFPLIDTCSASMLSQRQICFFNNQKNTIHSLSTTERRLRKLRKMGLVNYARVKNENLFSLTPLGAAHAQAHFDQFQPVIKADKITFQLARHHQMIARTVAQLTDPRGTFVEKLNLKIPKIENFCNETMMRQAQNNAKRKGEKWIDTRKNLLTEIKNAIENHNLTKEEAFTLYPQTLVVGGNPDNGEHAILYPDAALLAQTKSGETVRIALEIELHKKTIDGYKKKLRTWQRELSQGNIIYDYVFYFTDDVKGLSRVMKIAEKTSGTNVIESKRLLILPIVDRDHKPISKPKRELAIN